MSDGRARRTAALVIALSLVLSTAVVVLLPATAGALVSADLSVTIGDSPDPVAPAGDISYAISVTNIGPATSTAPTLSAAGTATNTTFKSITAPTGWSCTNPLA